LHDRAENECVVRDDLRLADGRGLHRLDAQRLSRLRRGAHQKLRRQTGAGFGGRYERHVGESATAHHSCTISARLPLVGGIRLAI